MKLNLFKEHPTTGLIASIAAPIIIGIFLTLLKAYFPAISALLAIGTLGMFLASVFFLFQSIDSQKTRWILGGFLMAICILAFWNQPTIFTGRDQGSISMAAIELTTNHTLTFSVPIAKDLFSIYGPGEALHFPGFFYDDTGNLLTKFPLGYTVFLASFFSLFGTNGFIVANTLLLAGSLLLFFSLIQSIKKEAALIGAFLGIFSFLPLWFSKFTLTENIALFLFLGLTFSLTQFFHHRSTVSYWSTLGIACLFPFIRIEGFVFFGISLLILFFHPEARRFARENISDRILAPLFGFLSLLVFDMLSHTSFYRVIGKEFFGLFSGSKNLLASTSSTLEKISDLFSLFALYGFLPFFVAGSIGTILLFKQRNWIALFPIFLALPTIFYLISPSITPDHPWMLRRFLFSIWPCLITTGMIALFTLFDRNTFDRSIRNGVFVLLILVQIPVLSSFIFTKEHTELTLSLEKIAGEVSDTDRILVDKRTTGDGFALLSGPLVSLYGKNAAYFFNPSDLDKLPWRVTEKTYLITPTETFPEWQKAMPSFVLTPKSSFSIINKQREPLPMYTRVLPKEIQIATDVTLYEITPLSQ